MILVFGGGGQLGQELVLAARHAGVSLVAVNRSEADISDDASVERAIGAVRPTLVVNAAAYNFVDEAEGNPDAAARANTLGPAVLARAAAAAGLPLVHISTDYVFDGASTRSYVEDDPVAPLGIYGWSKAGGEKAVRSILPEHFILRTAWLFGACGANSLKAVVKLAAERDELAFVADQTGSPTSGADLAKAILVLARTPRASRVPGTYHVAGSPPATRHALACAIVSAQAPYTGRNPAVRAISSAEYPMVARRPRFSVLNSAKFGSTFGFRPGDWRPEVGRAVARIFAERLVS